MSLGRALLLSLSSSACGVDSLDVASEPSPLLEVGVISYSETARKGCDVPGAASVTLTIAGGGEHGCALQTGSMGEGYWAAPTAVKYPISAARCDLGDPSTAIVFCRTEVAPHEFRPLTSDPTRTDQFYALLKFGASCPPASVEVSKFIYTETAADVGASNGFNAAAEPNEAQSGIGTHVLLHFCLFASAAVEKDTMQRFPELGFPYAVFHDFEGQQPEWVMFKRWLLTDESDTDYPGFYLPSLTEQTRPLLDFVEHVIVEDGALPRSSTSSERERPETVFDLARVR